MYASTKRGPSKFIYYDLKSSLHVISNKIRFVDLTFSFSIKFSYKIHKLWMRNKNMNYSADLRKYSLSK